MITVKPWLAMPVWAPTNSHDQESLLTTQVFGYSPIVPNNFRMHRGIGNPVRCENSGEWFPESRIKKQWDGKNVGDIYYEEAPRGWR